MLSVLFSPYGRIGFTTYLAGIVIATVTLVVLFAIVGGLVIPWGEGGFATMSKTQRLFANAISAISLISAFAIPLWMLVALLIKRLHDFGYSGLWVLTGLTGIGFPILLFIGMSPAGTEDENRFGLAPNGFMTVGLPDGPTNGFSGRSVLD